MWWRRNKEKVSPYVVVELPDGMFAVRKKSNRSDGGYVYLEYRPERDIDEVWHWWASDYKYHAEVEDFADAVALKHKYEQHLQDLVYNPPIPEEGRVVYDKVFKPREKPDNISALNKKLGCDPTSAKRAIAALIMFFLDKEDPFIYMYSENNRYGSKVHITAWWEEPAISGLFSESCRREGKGATPLKAVLALIAEGKHRE
jgi:hypothetical protein